MHTLAKSGSHFILFATIITNKPLSGEKALAKYVHAKDTQNFPLFTFFLLFGRALRVISEQPEIGEPPESEMQLNVRQSPSFVHAPRELMGTYAERGGFHG